MEGKQLENCRVTELISGDLKGEFNEEGVVDFVNSVKLHECGVSYAVVAIMGPQSSGKSTLMNHLFHTNFQEMDAKKGRNQTTKGIWMAKAPTIEPFTLVVDVEGSDGIERREKDSTSFERKSALFALAFADVVLINMWCNDIGRDQAANRPLLKTIFEVMVRLFSPRKTTLLFVIRDKSQQTPFEALETKLREDVQKIWEVALEPQAFKATPIPHLSEFFKVEVVGLSHYEYEREQFLEEVGQLRNRFRNSISPGGIAGDRQGVVPASDFCLSAKNIWKTIKQNKDLDLPAQKILVAYVRCDEIAKEKLGLFASHEKLLDILQKTESTFVSDFGPTISSILGTYLSIYDSEAEYYDEKVRNEKREYLESEALKVVYPAYINTVHHICWKEFKNFKIQVETLLNGEGKSVAKCQLCCLHEFDKQCSEAGIKQAKWDTSTVRRDLVRDMESHIDSIRTQRLATAEKQCRLRLRDVIGRQMESLFVMRVGGKDIGWDDVRSILSRESEAAGYALRSAFSVLDMDQKIQGQKVHEIEQYARSLVETIFRNAAKGVLQLMLQRYTIALEERRKNIDAEKKPDEQKKRKKLYRKCLKLLSTMAVLRLDEADDCDGVEVVLASGLIDEDDESKALLDSTTWKGVPPEMTLITPAECKDIWEEFRVKRELSKRELLLIGTMGVVASSALAATSSALAATGLPPLLLKLTGVVLSVWWSSPHKK